MADETDYVTSPQRNVRSRLPLGTEQATAKQTIAAEEQTIEIERKTTVAGKRQTTAKQTIATKKQATVAGKKQTTTSRLQTEARSRRLSSSLTSLVTSTQSVEGDERSRAGRVRMTSETQYGCDDGFGGLPEMDRQGSRNKKKKRDENQGPPLLNKMSSSL